MLRCAATSLVRQGTSGQLSGCCLLQQHMLRTVPTTNCTASPRPSGCSRGGEGLVRRGGSVCWPLQRCNRRPVCTAATEHRCTPGLRACAANDAAPQIQRGHVVSVAAARRRAPSRPAADKASNPARHKGPAAATEEAALDSTNAWLERICSAQR